MRAIVGLTAALTFSFGFTAMTEAAGLFEQEHPWSRTVAGFSPSPTSDAIIARLQKSGGWGAGNRLRIDFSLALLEADRQTPRRTITAPPEGYCFDGPDCEALPLEMPIPEHGFAEGSDGYTCDREENDCHVLVRDRDAKKLYELYQASGDAEHFIATAAIVWDLTKQYGETLRGEQCTSADAAGLPLAALLTTADEVAAGEIAHALRFILPNDRIKAGVYVHPATHAGGPKSTETDAPPYGVRLRLKKSFDEATYGPGARIVLQALKTYGMILSDGGNIALTFADDRLSKAKWSELGIEAGTFDAVSVGDFEVVDLGPEIALTYDCQREP